MPRSSKAPPLPPEPDYNELIQNDVARIKRLLGLDVNRLALGSEVEGIVTGGIFGSADYTVTGANTIEFVNVSTSMAPQQTGYVQTDFTAPLQVTGLTATAAGNTQINLNWTANTEIDLTNYNVYRGTSSGFGVILGTTTPAGTPSTNSYVDAGRTASTTYYYKVSAVDSSNNIGILSAEANATTAATPPPSTANLWLKFDGNYSDSSTFSNSVSSFNSSGFVGSGVFGTNSVKLNTPTAGTDHIEVTANTNINIDMAGKWSFSCWIYSTTTNGDFFSKFQSSNNFTLANVYFGDLKFFVVEGGTTIGKISGSSGSTLSLNTWHHIVGTWDGTTNTPNLYLDKVLQTTTSNTGLAVENANLMIGGHISSGNRTGEFDGRIDEFQLFKGVVLTQTQVNNLFATNAP